MTGGTSVTDPTHGRIDDPEQKDRAYLKREFQHILPDITDDDLRAAINEWLVTAVETDDDPPDDRINSRLMEISEGYPMRRKGGQPDEECFPAACADCEHYGRRCPPLADRVRKKELSRIMAEYDDESALRSALRQYAHDVGCDIIKAELDEDSDHDAVLDRGRLLLRYAEEQVYAQNPQDEQLRAALHELGVF